MKYIPQNLMAKNKTVGMKNKVTTKTVWRSPVSLMKQCLSVIFAMFLCNCATIISGTSQNIRVDSEPHGATIMVDGIPMGKTPATISVVRPGFSNKMLTLRKEGYADTNFMMQKNFNLISALSLVLGVVPFVVDLGTGAFMSYDPANYSITLDRLK